MCVVSLCGEWCVIPSCGVCDVRGVCGGVVYRCPCVCCVLWVCGEWCIDAYVSPAYELSHLLKSNLILLTCDTFSDKTLQLVKHFSPFSQSVPNPDYCH